MVKNFSDIAFTDGVKAQQEQHGSRLQYARMDRMARGATLTIAETEFIAARDGFYLATVGETGYPYVQFRGGPPGFLHVLDTQTLGYADFRGNRQYITVGNLDRNDRAALILMDYANQSRLKIYARIEVINEKDRPQLIETLRVPGYDAKIERAMLLHVEAFDWNCPQHITPRFTMEEIRAMNAPLYEHVAKLEAELAKLRAQKN
ncbi:MAG TPA: pyridoxamine 5'-phosphate oxidase family protein [Nitrospiraceae bacterium]|nr:pyridoxamine 5'-phosphate oxidase family protein [Nitrospiraceae bacterium]